MAEQTDDQRAAEERVLELCDMDYERAAATAAEFDRLRAELAETRAAAKPALELADALLLERARLRVAGDELARAVRYYDAGGAIRWSAVQERAVAWRSVRGDAPAQPTAADPQAPAVGDRVRVIASDDEGTTPPEWVGRLGAVDSYAGRDVYMIKLDGMEGVRALRHDEIEPAPAVELPVTLSSVDDVAAVCAFLDMSQVRERTWYCNPQVAVWAAGTCDEGTGGVEIDSVPLHLDVQFPAATSLVVAAIEAARGGSR